MPHSTTVRPPVAPPAWFRLARHDEPAPPAPAANPPVPAPAPPVDPAADPAPPADLGEGGQTALKAERAARKAAEQAAEAARREAAEAQRRIQEFEDAQRSELERAQLTAQRADETARAATGRAVTALLTSAATAAQAEYPDVVVAAVGNDVSRYLTATGEIDDAAIATAVQSYLTERPNLVRQTTPPPPPAPRPDPTQGGGSPPAPIDYLTATPEEVAAENRRLGVR